jgi:hypothetical protein
MCIHIFFIGSISSFQIHVCWLARSQPKYWTPFSAVHH